MTLPPIVVIGNPGHRRVEEFVRAVIDAGLSRPIVVAHADLVDAPERLTDLVPSGPALIRIESVGQSHAVARALLRKGRDGAPPRASVIEPDDVERATPSRFELRAPAQLHAGYVTYLRALGAVIATRPWRPFSPTDSIELCFDKNASARWLAARGVCVPQALASGTCLAELERAMEEAGEREAWVKLPYASSASGLAVVRRAHGRCAVFSTLAAVHGPTGPRFFNTRRVRRYDEPARADAVISFLLAEGARIERSVDKTHVLGRFVDLRVLVVAGVPAFVVARGSRHPITNLHLGGVEVPLDAVRGRLDAEAYRRALGWCVDAADGLDVLQLGLDVAFDRRTGAPVVLEMNAFGDLLPRARADGLDPYRYQVRALRSAADRIALG